MAKEPEKKEADKAPAKAAADSESKADRIKRVLDNYKHQMDSNAPRNPAELKDLEDLLGHQTAS